MGCSHTSDVCVTYLEERLLEKRPGNRRSLVLEVIAIRT